MAKANDEFDRQWITEHSLDICAGYDHGVLTLRGLHYQLVALGMTNTIQHYKRVVDAMRAARRNGTVAYSQFSDHDREAIGETDAEITDVNSSISYAKGQLRAWMTGYSKNRWENQDRFVEVWIEKKALQGVFMPVCEESSVALCPCKGYPSLTFLHEASIRFNDAQERSQQPTIVYFGDHDPSGEDIPRSLQDNFMNDFYIDVDVQVVALHEQQCLELKLPPAPAKATDSRTKNFTGLGQVELDAVKPEILQDWCRDAIGSNFDDMAFNELDEQEENEREKYQTALRDYVNNELSDG